MSMHCPDCGNETSRVVDSRPIDGGTAIRRRRECQACEFRFTTYERTEWDVQVKKSDGAIEPFSRAKLRAGIERAVEKRPVSGAEIDAIVDEVEDRLREQESRIVDSTVVGDLVSERLHELDSVAYLRFVSVYRAFSDPEEFRRELDRLLENGPDGEPAGTGSADPPGADTDAGDGAGADDAGPGSESGATDD